jgi:hypothetical protein
MKYISTHKLLPMSLATIAIATCGRMLSPLASHLKETHPYQAELLCRRAQGSTLEGQLYDASGNDERLLGTFSSGHIGSCEFAKRSSRNGTVCIESNYSYKAINIATRQTLKNFDRNFSACTAYTKNWKPLANRPGFIEFIDNVELSNTLKNLPRVSDPNIDSTLHSPDTMWYDEETMVFAYQDSFGSPTGPEGLRANRVAFDTGSNSSEPDIRLLTEFFEPTRFKFPFALTAGGTDRSNTYVLNFWSPPKDDHGKALPVIWWRNGSHWHWTFPVGTVIGEVLMQRDPAAPGEWYVFDIRSRQRERDNWKTDIFRPFINATQMADAIKQARPNWQSTDLAQMVQHLENPATLTPARLESKPYRKIFAAIDGFYDYLPETTDKQLIKDFLTTRTFQSSMNQTWKTNGSDVTYAAASKGSFNIVPPGFIGGMLASNEASCVRCHDQTSRPLGQLDSRVVLYGEIWGEDQIFTWHPFKPVTDMFTVSDESRIANPRMVEAGLLIQRRPGSNDPAYRELPRPYAPDYETH